MGTAEYWTSGSDGANHCPPARDVPVGGLPVGELPARDVPVGELPVGELPVGELPVGELPVGELSVGELSVGSTNEGVRHMRYWLVKSEPEAFSWDQQVANGVEPWTGVRNHAAKLNLKAMSKGDLAFFYHSNTGKEIVGVVEVAREAYPDPTAEKGDWVSVDMRAVSPVPKPVSLITIKAEPALAGIPLIRQSRLSVMELSPEHWKLLSRMGGWKR